MPEPSRLNKYTTAVLDECEAWLDEQGARYWHASAVPPTVRWVLPQHGTRRRREWELSFGCNPHDLRSWRVCLAERDRRGNVYDTREEFVGRSELCATAHRLTTAGLSNTGAHRPARVGIASALVFSSFLVSAASAGYRDQPARLSRSRVASSPRAGVSECKE